jgi:DnaJ-class molecular chaperone
MAPPAGENTPVLYQLFEVSCDADVAAIEKAFKTMPVKLHPDKANSRTAPQDREESESEKENHQGEGDNAKSVN